MAVLRQSEAANFGAQDTRQGPNAQVGPVGNRNPGSAVLDHTVQTPSDKVANVGWQLDLLKTLTQSVSPYVPQIAKNLTESAYLSGQAKATAGELESEINSDPITSMWQTAGHRDMMNQLRVLEAQQKFKEELPRLRTLEPQEAEQWIAQQRADLLPHIEAGSNRVRDGLLGKVALHERTAMAEYGDARKKWIVDNIMKTQGALVQGGFDRLSGIQQELMVNGGDGALYKKGVEEFAGNLYQGIWMNDRLPVESKVAMMKEAMDYALATNHPAVYDYLATTPLPTPDGSKATMLSYLPTEQMHSLANKRREVGERTAAFRNMEDTQAKAVLDVQLENGSYNGTWGELNDQLRGMMARGTIKEGEYQSTLKAYLKMTDGVKDQYALADAGMRGDLETIYALGGDPEKALKAVNETFKASPGKPGTPLNQQVQQLLVMGKNGMKQGYKAVGERLGVSVMQLGRGDGTIDQQHAENIRTVFQHMDGLDEAARGAAMTDLMSGMDDSTQTKMLLLRNGMKYGNLTFEQANTKADQIIADTAAMSASERAAVANQKTSEIAKAVREYDSNGLIFTGWNKLKGIVSGDAAAKDKITPSTSPWSNDQTVAEFASRARTEVMKEAHALSMLNPGLSSEDVVSKAAANVAARTISTTQGPLHLPAGVNKQKFFGTSNASDEELGRAVSTIVKPTTPGGKVAFTVADGKINFREVAADGSPTTHFGTVNPKEVNRLVESDREERFGTRNRISGAGVTLGKGNDVVSFSGRNTSTAPDEWAYSFREGLTQREGIKNVLYDDKTGKPLAAGEKPKGTATVGVGLTGDYMPQPDANGRYSKESLDKAFEKATNDAMYSGRRVANAIGKPNSKPAFMLLSELAYQSGNNFSQLTTYQPVLAGIRRGDKTAAIDAFKNTPAYKASSASRQNHYLDLINQI